MLFFSTMLAVIVIVALWWLLFPFFGIRHTTPRPIDFIAFQNLLRPDDDLFLRRNLSNQDYRSAKRLRTRAVQEYLLWIVHNSSEVQRRVSSLVSKNSDTTQAKMLHKLTTEVRVLSLKLWLALWLQWLFPSLDIKPDSILDAYENFAVACHRHLHHTILEA